MELQDFDVLLLEVFSYWRIESFIDNLKAQDILQEQLFTSIN